MLRIRHVSGFNRLAKHPKHFETFGIPTIWYDPTKQNITVTYISRDYINGHQTDVISSAAFLLQELNVT